MLKYLLFLDKIQLVNFFGEYSSDKCKLLTNLQYCHIISQSLFFKVIWQLNR